MVRKISLPQDLNERLQALTQIEEEVNGVLLYQQRGEDCFVDTIYMTGVGTEGHVQAEQERMAVINKFFETHPEYRFIKFHVHSRGTVRKFGEYYANHVSEGDIRAIKEQLKHDREFIALLITERARILTGIDNPKLKMVDSFPEYQERSARVHEEIDRISQELHIEHENFRARVKPPRMR